MHARIIVAAVLYGSALVAEGAELATPAIYARVSPSVVSILTTGAAHKQGSGVIIAANRILTNCHVVEDSTHIEVRFLDSHRAPARLLGRYSSLDLCALEAPTRSRPSVEVRRLAEVTPGLKVVAVGNPLGLTASVTEGLISGVREQEGFKLIQHSAPTSPGSSGGGLFDTHARLVALTTSSNQSGQNVNFAIPAEYANLLAITEIGSSKPTARWATFKELPFGSSRDALLRAFPDAVCEPQDQIVTCRGSTEYFGRRASYSIFLSNRGTYMVYARVFTSEMDQAFAEAGGALIDRFGSFHTATPGSFAQWRIGDGEEQSISLAKCDGTKDCLDKASPGVMVIVLDVRFKPEKRKEF